MPVWLSIIISIISGLPQLISIVKEIIAYIQTLKPLGIGSGQLLSELLATIKQARLSGSLQPLIDMANRLEALAKKL